MWFYDAAKALIKFDVPDDHDGPRHFEYGMGLMMATFLSAVASRRGAASAGETARRMRTAIDEFLAGKQ